MHQGVRPIGKAQHTWVCEHLPEAVLHPNLKKSDANPACGATQPLSLRWGFETTSRNFVTQNQHAPLLQKILKFHMLVKSKVFIPINRKGFR
jgi:hypothetical protein